ncbi:hypothetical protein ACHWQZ_G013152 [Mnemiopsis leidyi]
MNHTDVDEKRRLNEDFDTSPDNTDTIQQLDINEAFDNSSCGWGTLLFTIGTFFFCALEGAEIVVLTIVGPILRCEWELSSAGLSTLQISTLFTMTITPLLTCNFGDKHGRRKITLMSAVGVTTAGVLSGLAQSFWQFIVLRLITGFFIGLGTGPALALSGEVTPSRYRALALSGISLPWGIGGCVTGGIAYLTLNVMGWRGLIICTALVFSPCVVFLAVIRESARFEYYRGNVEEAEVTIQKLYKLNGKGDRGLKLKTVPKECVQTENSWIGCRRTVTLLQETDNLSNCILSGLTGVTNIYSYYLNAYTMPRILNEGYCTGEPVSLETSCTFDTSTLIDIGMINLSEPLSVALMLVTIEKFGRIKPGVGTGLVSVILPTALYFCVNRAWLFWFLLLLKVVIAAQGLLPPILMAEYSPTLVRSTMLSIVATCNRLGGLVGIVCSVYLFDFNVRLVFVMSQVSNLMFVFCMLGLNRETLGTDLG